MNRGARREDVFAHPDHCEAFLEILAALPARFGVQVHAYTLMPNHFHLLLESQDGRLSQAMQHLGAGFTRAVNHWEGWDGPIFRGRFRSRLVVDEDYWRYLLLYVHRNPVRAGLVDDIEDVDWSSHGAYAGTMNAPGWLTTGPLLDAFGGPVGYSDLVRKAGPPDRQEGPWVQSGDLWVQPPTPAVVGRDDRVLAFAIGRLESAMGVPFEELRARRYGRASSRNRRVAAWWLARATGMSQRAIASLLLVNEQTVCRWIGRVERERVSEPPLAEVTDSLSLASESTLPPT